MGSGDRRAHVARLGHHPTVGADVAGSARHALLAGRSDAARQVRQHDPDRDPAQGLAQATRQPGAAAGGRAARHPAGPGALALGPSEHDELAASQSGRRLRARELHQAPERRDGGGAGHRSHPDSHHPSAGAQLPDRRGGDRTRAPRSHDVGHAAGRDDRVAGADPHTAARLPLAGGRRGAARDGRGDRDGRARAAVASQLPDADQLAGSRDRRDDEPRARRRLRATDGLARAPRAGRRMGPRGGRGNRVQGGWAYDRRGRGHTGPDDARGERGRNAGPARPGGDRRGHLRPSERCSGAERDAGIAAPARPAPEPLGNPAAPLPPRGAAHRCGRTGRTADRPPRDHGPADPRRDARAGGPRRRAAHGPTGRRGASRLKPGAPGGGDGGTHDRTRVVGAVRDRRERPRRHDHHPAAPAGADEVAGNDRARSRRRGGTRASVGRGRPEQARAIPRRARLRAQAPGRRPARDHGPALGTEPRKQRRHGTAQRTRLGRKRREVARRRHRERRERGAATGKRNGPRPHRRQATGKRNGPCSHRRQATGKRNSPRPRGRKATRERNGQCRQWREAAADGPRPGGDRIGPARGRDRRSLLGRRTPGHHRPSAHDRRGAARGRHGHARQHSPHGPRADRAARRTAPRLDRLDRLAASLRRTVAQPAERSDARARGDDRRTRRPPLSGARARPRHDHAADRTG